MSKNKAPIGIKILSIKETSFINKLTDFIVENFTEEKLDVKVGMAVKGDSKKDLIIISALVVYSFKESESKKPVEFIKLETENTFKLFNIKDNEEKIRFEEDQIFIDDEFMKIFLNTSFGAIRGMFAYKMASLSLNIVLPLLDVNTFIKKDGKNLKKKNPIVK